MGELSMKKGSSIKLLPDTFLPVATSVSSGLVTATFAVPADAGTYFTGAITVAVKAYTISGYYITFFDDYFVCQFRNRPSGFDVVIGRGQNGYLYRTDNHVLTEYSNSVTTDGTGSGSYDSGTRTITLQLVLASSGTVTVQEVLFAVAKMKEQGYLI